MSNLPSENKPLIHWPHSPIHKLSDKGTYFVTCGTYLKQHHFKGAARLAVLQRGLLSVAAKYQWQLEAWAVFSNHYHFVGHSPADDDDAKSLTPMLGELHSKLGIWVNRLDTIPGRKVWHNFRETKLTILSSYLARLNYVHQNAVKHKLVQTASHYPWCSASWFEESANSAQQRKIYQMKTDAVKVYDEFEPSLEW